MKKNLIKRALSFIIALALIVTSAVNNVTVDILAKDSSLYAGAYSLARSAGNLSKWNKDLNGGDSGDNYGAYSTWEAGDDEKEGLKPDDDEYQYRIHSGSSTLSVVKGTEYTGNLPKTNDTNETQSKDGYIWFSTAGNSAGNISVKYEGLWIYQLDDDGRPVRTYVDATCEVTRINRTDSGTDSAGYVGIGDNIFHVKYIHLDDIKVKYTFYKAGTNNKIKLKFNTTMTDIDNEQYVAFSNDKLAGTFVSVNTKLRYASDDGMDYYIVDISQVDDNSSDKAQANHALGIQVEAATFSFLFGKYGAAEGDDPDDYADLSQDTVVQFLGSSGYQMRDYNPEDPTKTVSDKTEWMGKEEDGETDDGVVSPYVNHLPDVTKKWTYTVTQAIPSRLAKKQYYSNFEFYDQIDTCLEVLEYGVYRGESGTGDGKDVSEFFDLDITEGNLVTAKLKKTDEAKEAIYGSSNETYRLVIKVCIDGTRDSNNEVIWEDLSEEEQDSLIAKWKSHGHYSESNSTLVYDNEAYTVIDGTTRYTDKTKTYVDLPDIPGKAVSDSNETDDIINYCSNVTEHWTYKVYQRIPANAYENGGYTKFVLRDNMEQCVQANEIKVYADDDTDVTSWFAFECDSETIDENGRYMIRATLNESMITSEEFYSHSTYTLTIDASLKGVENWNTMTDAEKTQLENTWKEHGHYDTTETTLTYINKAQSNINGYVRTTNDVDTEVELPEVTKDVPGLNITKDVNLYEHQVGDTIHYTVKVWNANENVDTACFYIYDTTLPDCIQLNFDSVKISGINAENYTLKQSGNGWILRSKGEYALPYGTTITIEYDAVALVASNGTTQNNTAVTGALGIPDTNDSEQVYINSPKLNVVKTAPDTKYKVGDTVGYTVTITNINDGTFMRDIELEDLVTTEGLDIKEGSVAVIVDGKDVTSNTNITYNENSDDVTVGFTISTPYNLKCGSIPCIGKSPYSSIQNWTEKIKVTYEATITDKAALENSLDNTFTAPTTKNTNGVLIRDDDNVPSGGASDDESVVMKRPTLNIEKTSDKTEYDISETGTYTLVVTETKENVIARNVVISDKFDQEKGFEINADSIAVTLNKEDITPECSIIANDTEFRIETGKNISDEDEIVVTYTVTFNASGEYNNMAVTSADNANEDEDDNTVTVREITPVLNIVKVADKKKYKVGDTGKYTLTVTETVENATAENVMIKDEFKKEKGYEIDKDSIKVKLNGEDVTEECDITTSDTGMEIKTNGDLAYGDELVVMYKVKFSAKGKYKNTATAMSENTEEVTDDNTVEVEKENVITSTINKLTSTSPKTGMFIDGVLWVALVSAAVVVVMMGKRKKMN